MVAYAGGLGWWSCFQVTILVDLLGSQGLGPLVAGYVGALIWLTLSDPRLVGWPSSLCDIGPRKSDQDQRRLYLGDIGSLCDLVLIGLCSCLSWVA